MAPNAVVFGGKTPGNGKGIADRLKKDGYDVVALTHDESADSPTTHGDGSVVANMANASAVVVACKELSRHRPRAVVYADMFFAMEDLAQFDHDLWKKSVDINLTAPNIMFRELLPSIPEGGAYVIVTSTEGFVGSYGASAYAASKAAVHNLVKSLANIAGSHGVRVNAVAAGWIGGVMDTDEVFNMSRQLTPLGRLGTPKEVGAAVAFLLGEDASFVNGTVLVVDGGYSGVDPIARYEYEQSLADKADK